MARAPHTPFEDVQAVFTGTLFVSLALILYGQAGVAFVLHHLTGISFGKLFFAVNLPFYGFAWKRMGREFTLKTLGAVTLLTALTEWSPRLFAVERLHPAYAAILGGLLLGAGCLFLARHRASLGGATVVSLYLQQTRGWRAGKVQMAIDIAALALAAMLLPRAVHRQLTHSCRFHAPGYRLGVTPASCGQCCGQLCSQPAKAMSGVVRHRPPLF